MYDCTNIAEKHGISKITLTTILNNNPKFELVLKLVMGSLDVVVSSDMCNFKHRKKTGHEFHKSRIYYYIVIHTAECYKSHHEIFCIASTT